MKYFLVFPSLALATLVFLVPTPAHAVIKTTPFDLDVYSDDFYETNQNSSSFSSIIPV